jgi:hypothetical protein
MILVLVCAQEKKPFFQAILKCAAPDQIGSVDDDAADLVRISSGPYSLGYVTLNEIGCGAFGSVRAGYRKDDGRMVRIN